jgi:hypothetical protein
MKCERNPTVRKQIFKVPISNRMQALFNSKITVVGWQHCPSTWRTIVQHSIPPRGYQSQQITGWLQDMQSQPDMLYYLYSQCKQLRNLICYSYYTLPTLVMKLGSQNKLSGLYACNDTNFMHYLSSVYSVTILLHISGLLVPIVRR